MKPFSWSVTLSFTSVGWSVCPPPLLVSVLQHFCRSRIYILSGDLSLALLHCLRQRRGKFLKIDDLRFGAVTAWGRGFNVSNHAVLELCIFGQFFFFFCFWLHTVTKTLLETKYDTNKGKTVAWVLGCQINSFNGLNTKYFSHTKWKIPAFSHFNKWTMGCLDYIYIIYKLRWE